jgi:hypothetical protein
MGFREINEGYVSKCHKPRQFYEQLKWVRSPTNFHGQEPDKWNRRLIYNALKKQSFLVMLVSKQLSEKQQV